METSLKAWVLTGACVLLSVLMAGCETVKSYFPDKEKDYRYSVEIPELDIPPDLSKDSIDLSGVDGDLGSPDKAQDVTAQEETAVKKEKPKKEKVRFLEYAGGASRLRIDESFERAWRVVGKAISHQSLEIIDRNREAGLYYVQYDPDSREVEDGSLWDEFVFFFGGDPTQEKEYHIRLMEYEAYTEVFVLDDKDQPLSRDAGLKLLKSLYETIKKDYEDEE